MVNFAFLLFGILSFIGQTRAAFKPSQPSQYCFYSVYTSLSPLTWTAPAASSKSLRSSILEPRKAKSATYCTSKVEATSIYASAKAYCSAQDLADGIVYWGALCKSVNATLIDLANITATINDDYITTLPTLDPESGVTAVTKPSLLTRSYYERSYRSYVASVGSKPKSTRLGWGVMGFWGGVLLLGITANLFNILSASLASAKGQQTIDEKPRPKKSLFNPIATLHHWSRLYIIIPAALGRHHQRRLMWCTIPKRLDSLIVIGFWALIIILNCVSYGAFHGNTVYPTIARQLWVYIGPRTGIIAYCCLPWLWIFAGRNNIFIWATGWSYRTFSIFHRHIARATTILSIVHAISYTVKYCVYSPGTYTTDLEENWFRLGFVALILMCLLLVFSSSWLRVKFYEVFLLIHIGSCVVLLIALYVHTTEQDGKYNGYLWPTIAIWSFDRFCRLVRLVYCNIHVKISRSSIKTSFAEVSYDKDEDVIRIDVFPGSTILKPGPGQYYHLYQPFTFRGWENHPFTLGSYNIESSASSVIAIQDEEKGASVNVQSSPSESELSSPTSYGMKLTFWVRPYDGWTKRLRNQCLRANGTIRQRFLIEGPYGHKAPLQSFDNVVLITGGTGISSALPYILDHSARSASNRTRASKIDLFWAAKQGAFINKLCKEELAPALERSDFTGHFYATSRDGPAHYDSSASDSDEITPVESKNGSCNGDAVQIQHGRPDIHHIITTAASEASVSRSRVVVLVCGPADMADQARAAVQAALKDGCQSMEYIEDTFGW